MDQPPSLCALLGWPLPATCSTGRNALELAQLKRLHRRRILRRSRRRGGSLRAAVQRGRAGPHLLTPLCRRGPGRAPPRRPWRQRSRSPTGPSTACWRSSGGARQSSRTLRPRASRRRRTRRTSRLAPRQPRTCTTCSSLAGLDRLPCWSWAWSRGRCPPWTTAPWRGRRPAMSPRRVRPVQAQQHQSRPRGQRRPPSPRWPSHNQQSSRSSLPRPLLHAATGAACAGCGFRLGPGPRCGGGAGWQRVQVGLICARLTATEACRRVLLGGGHAMHQLPVAQPCDRPNAGC